MLPSYHRFVFWTSVKLVRERLLTQSKYLMHLSPVQKVYSKIWYHHHEPRRTNTACSENARRMNTVPVSCKGTSQYANCDSLQAHDESTWLASSFRVPVLNSSRRPRSDCLVVRARLTLFLTAMLTGFLCWVLCLVLNRRLSCRMLTCE